MIPVNRNRLIARLHAMRRELGLDEELYRDKLEQITGKRSAAQLSDAELEEAVTRFRQGARVHRAARMPATKQGRMIQAQWISLYNLGAVQDASDEALMAFVKRQTGLDAVRWLNSHQDVVKVAEALKDWMAREGVEWSHPASVPPFMKLPAFKVAVAQWRKLTAKGTLTANRTWTGNARPVAEEVMAYAMAIARRGNHGAPDTWTNQQWTRVNRALGAKMRKAAAAAKEKAA